MSTTYLADDSSPGCKAGYLYQEAYELARNIAKLEDRAVFRVRLYDTRTDKRSSENYVDFEAIVDIFTEDTLAEIKLVNVTEHSRRHSLKSVPLDNIESDLTIWVAHNNTVNKYVVICTHMDSYEQQLHFWSPFETASAPHWTVKFSCELNATRVETLVKHRWSDHPQLKKYLQSDAIALHMPQAIELLSKFVPVQK